LRGFESKELMGVCRCRKEVTDKCRRLIMWVFINCTVLCVIISGKMLAEWRGEKFVQNFSYEN
jgi:hypothetical protein